MPVQVLQANPRVADDTGRVAVQRGPLLYCMEAIDQPRGVDLADVALDLSQKPGSQFEGEYRKDLLGGMVALRHNGVAYDRSDSENALYSRYSYQTVKMKQVPLTLIPYYAWANREATEMQVWTPVSKA